MFSVAVIEVENLHSKLIGASKQAMRAVDMALAAETPGSSFSSMYQAGRWDGLTRFYSVATGKFPTGLLSKAVEALKDCKERYTIKDLRTTITTPVVPSEIQLLHSELGSIILRDYQHESVVNALKATRGVIHAATNAGKTEIACGIIGCLKDANPNEKIVFFTHSKEIFNQSCNRISERLGIEIGRVGGGIWDEKQITIAMIPTVAKYLSEKKVPANIKDPSEYKERCKKCKKFLSSVTTFLVDEVHHASSDTWYKIFMKLDKAYYRFGLTGTIDESDQINLLRLYGCTGKPVIRISNKFLIDHGYSAKPVIYLFQVRTKNIVGCDYITAREEGIIYNEMRNSLFMDKVAEREKSGKQCLIIVNEIEHGDILQRMLEERGIESAFVHGNRTDKVRKEALEALSNGSLRVLIATSILDEGVDVSGINCLFMVAGGKSMRQILQRVGRGLRKKKDGSELEVYDALDYHNEYLVDHTLERYTTYKEEGFDIRKI